jgi:hypothetical protein
MMRLLLACLLLTSCGSSGSQDYSIKVFAVNVDCKFAELVTREASSRFYDAGIALITDFYCVEYPDTYEFGEKRQALSDLKSEFGNGHFLLPKFGNYFDGYQSGNSSLSVSVVGRLTDSAEQMAHEVAHQFGATHDLDNCNIMSLRRCGYPAKFNEKAIKEMR